MKCPNCNLEIHVQLTSILPPALPPRPQAPLSTGSSSVGDLLGLVNDADLTEWELEFIASTRTRFDQYGEGIRMSVKQMDRLRSIAAR